MWRRWNSKPEYIPVFHTALMTGITLDSNTSIMYRDQQDVVRKQSARNTTSQVYLRIGVQAIATLVKRNGP